MPTTFWTFHFSWTAALGGGTLLALTLALLWRELRRVPRRRDFAAAQALRLLAAGLLVLALFRPERVSRTRSETRPGVAILCDGSGSMATRDVPGGTNGALTRREWLDARRAGNTWRPLTNQYRVAVEDFAAAGENPAAAAGQGTDLDQALLDALERHTDLRAILLLTDGDWNLGRPPATAATRLALQGIPVFAVTVGSETPLPDLDLQSALAPAYGLIGERISLPFTIRNNLPREVRTRVELSGAGAESGRDLVLPPLSVSHDSLAFAPGREGVFDFRLDLPVEPDEVSKDNNSRAFRMAVRREKLKVLLVDTEPRWEFRFLRNALDRDPGVEVDCLLLHPGLGPAAGRNYLSAFPAGREVLAPYDVIFLGDAGPVQITAEQAEWIRELVTRQASGLVFLPGRRGFQAGLTNGPLGELLPVTLEPVPASESGEPDSGKGSGARPEARLELTPRGAQHLLTMLADNPEDNPATWRRLPGFFWHAPVERAKPGSEVLAVHATQRNQYGRIPLLVTRPAGHGKVLYLGIDSAWRWRRGVEDLYHYRFWRQVARWMAHQRHLAHAEGIRFFFQPESPAQGEKVFLHATVWNQAGFPVEKGPVEVIVTRGGQPVERLELAPAGEQAGVFDGAFTPRQGGDYGLEVLCRPAGRRLLAQVAVRGLEREPAGRPARPEVLREIAAITGGQSGGLEELDALVQTIRLLPEARPAERRLRLWCHPLWAALIIGLLTLYWSARKLLGLM